MKNRKNYVITNSDSDPYAKRTAGRVVATPALQSDRVGPASSTTPAGACGLLEYPHLAVGARSRRHRWSTIPTRLWRRRSAPHLNISPKPVAMSHQIHTYTELRQQIHDDLRMQHPEWVQPNGESPMCDSYESRLVELLENFTGTGSNESIAAVHRILEQASN